MAKRILLVEDEAHLIDVIKLNLEMEDYIVKVAEDGRKALQLYNDQRFDLIILDLMLPNISGIQVCETIRVSDKKIPILILSAKGSGSDRVHGLKAGADDYLVKPFNLEELLLRVQGLMKRGGEQFEQSSSIYEFAGNVLNFEEYEYQTHDGQKGMLSEKEAKLLSLFIDKKDQVVSRDLILELVWGVDVYPSTRTIDNFLLAFRKRFEKDPKDPKHFLSVRGVGYKFKSSN